MSEEPKSIWKKSFKGRTALVVWLAVAAFTIMLGSFIAALLNYDKPMSSWQWAAGILAGICLAACLFLIYIGWPLARWLFWKNWRRGIFLLACLATLIALFYAEEDWRGWHAWNQFKRDWEAKGEKFDWQSVVPPPVPDDQNFAMAPIWVESIKATLGPANWRQWRYPDDGRTNFTDRLPTLWHNNEWSDVQPDGDWARGTVTDLKMWQSYYRTPPATKRSATTMTNDFPVAPQPQTPAKDILLALSKFDPVIEELRQDSARPYSRFPLGYDGEDKATIWLPHLALLKRCSLVLQLRATAELQNDESGKALDDLRLSLRLVDAVRTEPFWISQLVRIAMLQIAIQPIYEGLAEHKWSDAQLAALDAELAKLDFPADYQSSGRGVLGFLSSEFQYLRRARNPEYLFYYGYNENRDRSPEAAMAIFGFRHCPGGWFYQNLLRCSLTGIMNFLPALNAPQRLALPETAGRANAMLKSELAHPNPYNFIERQIVLGFNGEFDPSKILVKFAYAQATVDLARTAIALERYRLAHGGYPESLDALAPQFIEKVPHDIIGGGPLHYRLNSDGQFVLYSLGWNETDDGGVVVLQKNSELGDEMQSKVDINQGDWVWKYPQK